MSNYKDGIYSNLLVRNTKGVKEIVNEDGTYISSSITCEGGLAVHKGISIGMQDKMVSGLIIYDNENFYGFSDKFGLVLLSNNNEYSELEIPDLSTNKLNPVSENDSFNTNENKKKLNIELLLKDSNNFFLKVDRNINNLELLFDVELIIDDETMLSQYSLVFINESNIDINIEFLNNGLYYSKNFNKLIFKNKIIKFNIDFINNDYILIDNITYN